MQRKQKIMVKEKEGTCGCKNGKKAQGKKGCCKE